MIYKNLTPAIFHIHHLPDKLKNLLSLRKLRDRRYLLRYHPNWLINIAYWSPACFTDYHLCPIDNGWIPGSSYTQIDCFGLRSQGHSS